MTKFLSPNTVVTWSQLSKAFLNKYFSPSKMSKFHMDIIDFNQHERESLYET